MRLGLVFLSAGRSLTELSASSICLVPFGFAQKFPFGVSTTKDFGIVGAWLQRNGISVIPCVRWGKRETYNFAFDGIEPGGTIAVGTVGAMREKDARKVFEDGFRPMLNVIAPSRIIVYGSRNSPAFKEAEDLGVEIVQFDTETAKAFMNGSA